jgi:anti-sigma B factor antagonist
MGSELTVHSEVRGNAVVLRFDGDVDLMTVPVVNQSIKAALEQKPGVLVIDLGGVGFLASAGLSELVGGHRLAGDLTVFRVVAPSRATSRPLEMVGLTTVFGVFPTLDEALASPAHE